MISQILAVFFKELRDTLRDKRTIFAMIVFPVVFYPSVFFVMDYFTEKEKKEAEDKPMTIGLKVGFSAQAKRLRQVLERNEKFDIRDVKPKEDAEELVKDGKLDAVVVMPSEFLNLIKKLQNPHSAVESELILVYYKGNAEGRLNQLRLSRAIRPLMETKRFFLTGKGVPPRPLDVMEINVASDQEQFGEMAGGILPFMLIMLVFFGSLYPAIDLGAGEKERGTLETLLTTSARLPNILIGKLLVVVLTGLISAGISMLSLVPVMLSGSSLPSGMLSSLTNFLTFGNVLAIIGLLVPLAVFFGSVSLTLSFWSRSAKEAQTLISPLSMVAVMVLMLSLVPTVRLTTTTAMVPILNVALTFKDMLRGEIDLSLVAIVYAVLFGIAAISVWIGARVIAKESTLFRA